MILLDLHLRPIHHLGHAGPQSLALVIFLLVTSLLGLYMAFRVPSLPEYQRDDDEPSERR